MFDWLYSRAGRWKKYSYLLGGVGVALSTATGVLSPVSAWISNLVGLIFGGELYSTLKNMEAAELIRGRQKKAVAIRRNIVELTSFSQAAVAASSGAATSSSSSISAILRQLGLQSDLLQVTEDFLAKADSDLPGTHVSSARKCAYINAAAQLVPSLFIAAVNILANIGVTQSGSDSDEQPLQKIMTWPNFVIVLLGVAAQYAEHTFYAASRLRTESNNAEGALKNLVIAQAIMAERCRQRYEVEIAIMRREIDEASEKLDAHGREKDALELQIREKQRELKQYLDTYSRPGTQQLDENVQEMQKNISRLKSYYDKLSSETEKINKQLVITEKKLEDLRRGVFHAQQVMFDVTTEQVNQQRDVELQTMTMM